MTTKHGTDALAHALASHAGTTPVKGALYRVRYTCLDCGSSWHSEPCSGTVAGARTYALTERRRYLGDHIRIQIEGPL